MQSTYFPTLAVIVPCYNEEEVLEHSIQVLKALLLRLVDDQLISANSYICLVDDGSRDATWHIMSRLSCGDSQIKGIRLSTNFGHQNALLAGLMTEMEHADCFVSIDADLQDDPSVIKLMVEKFRQGSKIVYGVRNDRHVDSFYKRFTAQFFYKLMHKLGGKTIYNHADFRLCSRQVLRSLAQFQEVNLFLRGIFPLMGFRSDVVEYERQERMMGQTKYPLRKMISFAWQGITSFSTTLLRTVTVVGIVMFLISIVLGVWALITYISGESIRGWASLLLVFSAFSGINMICLGIVGEYVSKIYQEVKKRPRYIIEEQTTDV
jgi:polyisoprenyl-phosphate glycosyltransferase